MKTKWTPQMYLAYYGMSREDLKSSLIKELYWDICTEKSKQTIQNVSSVEERKESMIEDTALKNVEVPI